MQTSSLISSALGASAPQPPAKASESVRKAPERSFADHVDAQDNTADVEASHTHEDVEGAHEAPTDRAASEKEETKEKSGDEASDAQDESADGDTDTPDHSADASSEEEPVDQISDPTIEDVAALITSTSVVNEKPGRDTLVASTSVRDAATLGRSAKPQQTTSAPISAVETVTEKREGVAGEVSKAAATDSGQKVVTSSAAMAQAVAVSNRESRGENNRASQHLSSDPAKATDESIDLVKAASTEGKSNLLAGAKTTEQPRSVFQMQLESAETGEARRERFRELAADAPIVRPTATSQQTNAATTAIIAQAMETAQVSAVTANIADSGAAPIDTVLSLSTVSGSDVPGLPQLLTEAVVQPGTAHRPETPRLVAQQMAEAFASKGERNVDVALNPEELGKVRMRVTTTDMGITMVIQAERPETSDLMRRHINELAEEFRSMGFQDISFEFSSGDSGESGSEQALTGEGGSSGVLTEDSGDGLGEITAEATPRLGQTGLDMRV